MQRSDRKQPLAGSVVRRLALVAAFLPLMAGSAAAQPVTVIIDVFDFDFGNAVTGLHVDPTIRVGDTVRWVWDSGFHSTTSAAGQLEAWNSGNHVPAFSFEHTFLNVGTFNYFCAIHGADLGNGNVGGMSGSVIVQPVPEPSSAVLLAVGLWGVVLRCRRRSRQEFNRAVVSV